MESDLTESALLYKLWAWADKNRKQLVYGVIALAVAGAILAFYMVHANEKQNDANNALSKLTSHGVTANSAPPTPAALLQVAKDFPGTDAAERATLLGAADLFASGKYDEALAHFQQFIKDHGDSPLAAQAALGLASSQDALGKVNEAITSYQGIVDKYPNQNVAPQARLALARLLESQGKFKEARAQLEELARSYPGTITSQAVAQLQQLNAAHPELTATNRVTVPPATSLSTTPAAAASTPAVTTPATSAAPKINIPAQK
jgi:predicted negative regulator of RcsB-dependent stress response